MPSALQLPPVLREAHDENDVPGPHPGVSIRMWAGRLCVWVWLWAPIIVFVARGKSQRSEPLSSKTMISIKCRCFLRLKWQACFYRQVSETSCSLFLNPEAKGKKTKAGFSRCFVSMTIQQSFYLHQKHENFLCDSVVRITNLFSVLFSKLQENTRKKQKTIKSMWFDNSSFFLRGLGKIEK